MARTKLTPKNTGHKETQRTQKSANDGQSVPSSSRIISTTKTKKKSRKAARSDVGDLTTSTSTNERENGSRTVKRVVAARSVKAWKPLRSSTKRYALQLFDTAVEMLLSRTNDSVLNDLQLHLARMRRRFADRLDKSCGPLNNITNYNNLHKLLDTSQQESDSRIQESLKKQLEEEERECRDLEEEMETYQLYADGTSELHPLLRSEAIQERSARVSQ